MGKRTKGKPTGLGGKKGCREDSVAPSLTSSTVHSKTEAPDEEGLAPDITTERSTPWLRSHLGKGEVTRNKMTTSRPLCHWP